MHHLYQAGKPDAPVFVLLHGTGGNERSLLPLVPHLNSEATVLSIRGNVSEQGMLRFFKRKAEGIYDIEDLHQRGTSLLKFIEGASRKYQFDMAQVILVGFSNGANIAIEMLLQADTPLKQGILLAPMYPVPVSEHDLSTTHVFMSLGKNDPIVSVEDSLEVVNIFERGGAKVTTHWVNSHEITLEAIQAAKHTMNL